MRRRRGSWLVDEEDVWAFRCVGTVGLGGSVKQVLTPCRYSERNSVIGLPSMKMYPSYITLSWEVLARVYEARGGNGLDAIADKPSSIPMP